MRTDSLDMEMAPLLHPRRKSRCQRWWKAIAVAGVLLVIGIVVTTLLLLWSRSNPMPKLPPACSASCTTFNHSAWDAFLQQHTQLGKRNGVQVNMVDYATIMQQGSPSLRLYLKQLEQAPLARLNATSRKALFINAYNALAIKTVVDNPCDGAPCASIWDISTAVKQVWNAPAGKVGGLTFSLNNIEDDYLRATYKDFRLHSSLNCASISCPNLRSTAYTADGLSEQLDEQMRLWMTQPRKGLLLSRNPPLLTLTKITHWYAADFAPSPRVTLQPYMPAETAKYVKQHPNIPLAYFDYDWSLDYLP